MPKTLGLGTVLRVENPATSGFLDVGHITNIPSPSVTKGEVEVTDFDSVAREFLGTLPDNGSIPFTGFANSTDVGQVVLRDDAVDPDAPVRGWEIYFERQAITCAFSGYLSEFTAFEASGVDDAIGMSGSIRVTGAITFTPDA